MLLPHAENNSLSRVGTSTLNLVVCGIVQYLVANQRLRGEMESIKSNCMAPESLTLLPTMSSLRNQNCFKALVRVSLWVSVLEMACDFAQRDIVSARFSPEKKESKSKKMKEERNKSLGHSHITNLYFAPGFSIKRKHH